MERIEGEPEGKKPAEVMERIKPEETPELKKMEEVPERIEIEETPELIKTEEALERIEPEELQAEIPCRINPPGNVPERQYATCIRRKADNDEESGKGNGRLCFI